MNILFFLKHKATVAYLYDDCSVRQGLEKMRVHGYTAIPVITHDGKYIGTVSEGDFLWYIVLKKTQEQNLKSLEECYIKDILRNKRDKAVKVSETMDNLLNMVMEQNFVPVVDDRGVFIGIITRKDIIKYFYEKEKKDSESWFTHIFRPFCR